MSIRFFYLNALKIDILPSRLALSILILSCVVTQNNIMRTDIVRSFLIRKEKKTLKLLLLY